MLVDEERVDRAMQTLACTDVEFAEWRGAVIRTEYLAEVAEALIYKSLTEGTVEDRKRAAKSSPEVGKAMEEYIKAVIEFEKLKARRAREVMVVDLYRTSEASRRQGNIR